ncbi:MAG: HRDC domain-containing protein [Anaerolineales bacterium]|jgi:ribonuclease D
MTVSLPPPVWVADAGSLAQLGSSLASEPRLAVDTESNSLHAYREQVCLIQFSTPQTDYLVDPLALHDLSAIAPLFSNPRIEKVFHAVEYDQICLKRDFDITFANIFDTMQAARILGYKQVGLDAILAEKLEISLDKRYQKADWGGRPLSPEMLNYARLDTHHLLDLRDSLQTELQERGRWELACEEFIRLAAGNGSTKADLPAWQRVKGISNLSRQQLAILQELCNWRCAEAERLGRPVFKVMDDKRLVSIAVAAPKSETELEGLNLTARQIYVFGSDILKAVGRGRKATPVHRPISGRPDSQILNRLNGLSAWRKGAAQKMEVESDVVLPKPWMHAIAEQNPRTLKELAVLMPQSPWRLKTFGAQLLQALQDKR